MNLFLGVDVLLLLFLSRGTRRSEAEGDESSANFFSMNQLEPHTESMEL